jgi:hypothetical protein
MLQKDTAEMKKLCPVIHSPRKDCYCYEINSGKVQDVLRYCNACYELCPVFQSIKTGKEDVNK